MTDIQVKTENSKHDFQQDVMPLLIVESDLGSESDSESSSSSFSSSDSELTYISLTSPTLPPSFHQHPQQLQIPPQQLQLPQQLQIPPQQLQIPPQQLQLPPQQPPPQQLSPYFPEIDSLWEKWSSGMSVNEKNVVQIFDSFKRETINLIKEVIVPTELHTLGLTFVIDTTKFMNKNRSRPFNGPLGQEFTRRLFSGTLPDPIVKRWFSNFDYIREYKEFIKEYGTEPNLNRQNSGNKLFSKYEVMLTEWANDMRNNYQNERLTEEERIRIDNELGSDSFNWSFVLDFDGRVKTHGKRRRNDKNYNNKKRR